MAEKTYTEADMQAALDKVSALEEQVAELTAAAGEAEVDAKVASVKADLEGQIAELQSKLDTATVEAETAKKSHDDLISYLEAETEAAAEAAALEARKAERAEAVKTVAPALSDEYVAENASRWAAMSDEQFTASLEDWKTVVAQAASKTGEETKEEEIPEKTAMTASADTKSNPLAEVMDLRFGGTDIRTI